jgi:dTDP-glucose pyrophosphorylase
MKKLFKAIIPSGGDGLRVKHVTRAIPKGFLPLYARGEDGKHTMIPVIQLILKSLGDVGVSDFCVVAGKNKTILVDYLYEFAPSFIFYYNSKGFGETTLRAKEFAGNDPVFIHADDGVLTGGYREAAELFQKEKLDGVLLLRETDNPTKKGVAEVEEAGSFQGHKLFRIKGVEEKPKNPKSNYMLSAVYIFSSKIFAKLEAIKGKLNANTNEFELTDAIEALVKDGKVYGLLLEKERWLNVGDPESYYKAIQYSYENPC